MKHKGRLLFLGTGNPEGIPVPFCSCASCRGGVSRLRPSVLITYQGRRFLVDVGPDIRRQLLHYAIPNIDGIFLTHAHYDHVGGIDEMRAKRIVFGDTVPAVASYETIATLKESKKHLFEDQASFTASIEFSCLEGDSGVGVLETLPFSYCSYLQHGMLVTGYRFGDLAYFTDMQVYEETIFAVLEGVETLVLSATYRNQPGTLSTCRRAHLTVEEAIEFFSRSGAKRLVITHIGHVLQRSLGEYKEVPGLEFASEGQEIGFSVDE